MNRIYTIIILGLAMMLGGCNDPHGTESPEKTDLTLTIKDVKTDTVIEKDKVVEEEKLPAAKTEAVDVASTKKTSKNAWAIT